MAEKDYSNNTQKLTDIYRVIVWKINWTGTGQQQLNDNNKFVNI